jgi:hypothetical protein
MIMSFLDDFLGSGNNSNNSNTPGSLDPAKSFTSATDQFMQQNMSAADILNAGSSIPRTIGGIPGIGSRIPGLGSTTLPGIGLVDKLLAPINKFKFGMGGTWESLQYSDDLNGHHPKFKFLFKVKFDGFPRNDFYHYVLRADKPKVRFQHQDVNYYNFRTRVLTGITYEPLSITFFDEIGNTLNEFFVNYMKERSGTGSGRYGIDRGFGEASSSKPYGNAYSENTDQKIIVEQIFANGTRSNRFIFINPRIENFDFDELSMEESNTGSHATVTFTYDAIEMMTVYGSTIHSWGKVDLLRGGGTSGVMNAGSKDGVSGVAQTSTATGLGIMGSVPNDGGTSLYNMVRKGGDMIQNLPGAAMGYVMGGAGGAIKSVTDTVSQGISSTLKSITSGDNAKYQNYDDALGGSTDSLGTNIPESGGDWSYE